MPFDMELCLPKPEVRRPRINEKYGMLQLAVRFPTLLADLAGIALFIYLGVVLDYVNPFSTAAAAWSLIPDLAETTSLCNTSRRIRRIPVVLIMVMEVITLGLLGGSWFWYLFGPASEADREKDGRERSVYVSFVLFAFHGVNLAIAWVDLCRRSP